MLSATLQPAQGAIATAAPNLQTQQDLTFLLEGISSSLCGGQLWGEGGAAVVETALQAFREVDLFDDPLNSVWGNEEAAAADTPPCR